MLKSALRKMGSIHFRLFVSSSLLLTLIIGFIGIAAYNISGVTIENEVAKSRVQVLKQVSRNINTIAFQLVSVSNLYYFDKELADILKSDTNQDAYTNRVQYNKVMSKFIQYTYSFTNLSQDVILFGYNGKMFSSDESSRYSLDEIKKQPYYQNLMEKDGKILWTSHANTLSALRVLNDPNNKRPYGILMLNIREEMLYDAYKSAVTGENIMYISDLDGTIISHTDKKQLGAKRDTRRELSGTNGGFIKDANDSILYSYYTIPELGWTIVEEIPLKVLIQPLDSIKYLILALMLLCLVIGLLLTYVIARKITHPIQRLSLSMKEVKEGNLDVVAALKGPNEIRALSEGFDSMLLTIRKLLDTVREEEKLKRRAELDFLQAQINPHFLYNTLNSIKCMISIGQNEAAENMMISFIRLLRKTLENEDEYITVAEELSNLHDYVNIQKMRYPDKFDVEYEAEEEVFKGKIPKLIIQPIVENAIFHGLEPKKAKGLIKITLSVQHQLLLIIVTDDGIGMSEEQANQLLRSKVTSERTFNRIGVFNVHERIMMNYGAEYGLEIHSQQGKGTSVILRLPFRT